MPQAARILTLHVSIDDLAQPVWRRITVDADITLRNLHHILQASFGWTSSHLHEFGIGDARYSVPDEDCRPGAIGDPDQAFLDDRKAKLGRLVTAGQRFTYLYDFGDSWNHTVHVEQVATADEALGYGVVIDGAGACPPEDSGGPYGYNEFVATIKRSPRSRAARDMIDWAGGEFNANSFDRRAANAALMRMGWNGWGKQ